jgi:hypothetical protein
MFNNYCFAHIVMDRDEIITESNLDTLPPNTPLEIFDALLEFECSEYRLQLLGGLAMHPEIDNQGKLAIDRVDRRIRERRYLYRN